MKDRLLKIAKTNREATTTTIVVETIIFFLKWTTFILKNEENQYTFWCLSQLKLAEFVHLMSRSINEEM